MNALRIICLVLAICVLGVLGWRVGVDHGQVPSAQPVRGMAGGGAALPAPPRPAPPAAPDVIVAAPAAKGGSAAPAAPVSPPPVSPLPVSPLPLPVVAGVGLPSPTVAVTGPEAPHQDRLTDVPEFAPFFDRLKLDFPHDYIAIVRHLDGGGAEATGANAAIWEALRDLEQSRGILAAQAAPAVLDRFFDARSAVLDGLAPFDARQCADFLYGVTADATLADFTAAHRGLVATLADRTLEAIADGRDRPAERTAPSASDLDALAAGLAARGLSPAEVGFLMDGTAPDPPLADSRVCAIGRSYLDVLHGLPADVRQRIYGLAAELLARS